MSTREYHHGNLPRALLDAALAVLAERSIAELSLREVARRAGVSHGAPAHHFGDKTGLLTALAAEGFELFRAALERGRQAGGDDAVERFRGTGRAYVRFAIEHRQHFELMFRPELLDMKRPALQQASAAAYGVLLRAVHDAQQAGLAKGIAADVLATGAWAFTHGLSTLHLGGNLPGRDLERDLDALLPLLFGVPKC